MANIWLMETNRAIEFNRSFGLLTNSTLKYSFEDCLLVTEVLASFKDFQEYLANCHDGIGHPETHMCVYIVENQMSVENII